MNQVAPEITMQRAKRQRSQAPRIKPPAYLLHPGSGQAYSNVPRGSGAKTTHKYHGVHGTPESRENYRRWLAELGYAASEEPQPMLCVAEGFLAWKRYVEEHKLFHKHGSPTGTVDTYLAAMRYVLDLYESLPLAEFSAFHLTAVARAMIAKGLARSTINGNLAKIKRLWDYFASNGLCMSETWLALAARKPMRPGEGGKETEAVQSVSEETLSVTMDHCTPAVKAMLKVLSWSGCRAGEVVRMRTCDVVDEHDALPAALLGKAWVYTPQRFKTEHHGTRRLVILGPQAMEVIEPWLSWTEPERYIFNPHEMRVRADRKRRRRGKVPNKHYNPKSLTVCINQACAAAGIENWHAHQLRHLTATRLATIYGLEITRLLLGHTSVKTTLRYVDRGVITADDREQYRDAIAAMALHG
jgi:integrase